MLTKLPLAQYDHPDRRDQDQNADDLERQVEICEQKEADVVNVVGLAGKRGERLTRRAQLPHDKAKLDKESQRDRGAASDRDIVYLAQFFRPQIKQHDDEEEQHHHGAGVDENLDNPDEESVERHKQ